MGKKIYKITKLVLLAIVIIILAVLSIYLIKKATSKKPVTKIFGYSFYYVETGSMMPIINVGDLIVVKEFDSEHYQVGMNVTYLLEGAKSTVTHQIVKREGNIITTRGMNAETNNTDDEPFDVNCIVGEVVHIWQNYYKFINFVKSPLGIICLALIGFGVVEGFGLLDKVILKKEENKENKINNNDDKVEEIEA